MAERPAFTIPWLSATLTVAAPALALLVGLALLDDLSWPHAAALAAVILVTTGLITRRHLKDLVSVIAYTDALAAQETVATPAVAGSLSSRLLSAVRRLNRSWQGRADALGTSIAINESLLDSLPDPIILLDSQRRVLFNNAAAQQQLGASGVGRDLASLVRDPSVLEAASAVLRGAPRRDLSLEIVDPAERHFAVRIEPLHEEVAGGGICVIAMVDLTAMKRIEEMRSDFIANASHELRTPLTSLIGFIETLRGPARDDATAREQFLELMQQQAQRMARLVRDLLSLSIIEMSEHRPPSGEIELGNLLRGVADALQLQAQSRTVKVDLRITDTLPKILGDGDQLTQLFQNLIDNAIKYGAPDSIVTVTAALETMPAGSSTASDTQAVAITVADQGEGIPKEHLPRLTERFYRVDAARSRAVGGTGLGLAIVKHIVSRHRGQLRIDSEPGQGSRFTVYLPVGEL